MDPCAVYDKNSDEVSTNLFRGASASSQPVMMLENEGKDDSITWFQRLSPDQKTTSRFSLPDWLRRSKGVSSTTEKDSCPTAGASKEAPVRPIYHTASMPDLNAGSQQDEKKPASVKNIDSNLIASNLAPLAQTSSRLQMDVPYKQEASKLTPLSTRRQHPPPHSKLSLPLGSGAHHQRTEDSTDTRGSLEFGFGKQPARSLTTVLRHLSTVIDRTGQNPQDYRDSDFKQYWMPDSQCKECYECAEKFTTLRRRHHCRVCGQIFCRRCCNQEVPGKFMGYTGNLRVCTYCCKIVLSYAQSSIGDLKMLQEDYVTLVASELPSSTTPDVMTPRKKMADSTLPRQRTFSSGSNDGCFDPFELVQTPSQSNLEKSVNSVEQERQHLLKDSAQLHQLWKLIQHPNNGIMFQNHRFRLRTYNDCIVGSELVDWLLLKDKACHRMQAVAIGQALLDAKWLESATSHDQIFLDEYALYRAGKTALSSSSLKDFDISLTEEGELDAIEDRMEPSWFREIDLVSEGDLTDDDGLVKIMPRQSEDVDVIKKHRRVTSLGDSTGSWAKGLRPATDLFTSPGPDKAAMETVQRELPGPWEQEGTLPGIGEVFPNGALSTFGLDQTDHARGPVLAHGWLDMDMVSQDNGEWETLQTLLATSTGTLANLTEQQLKAEGVDLNWKDTIIHLSKRICSLVKPDVMNGDDMDIRHYVHIKKVPGGSRADCFTVNGTICTKNLAHKKMSGHVSNPRILLLQSAIEHQRVENKLSSIEPIVLQEHEYLKKCVSRIASLKPDILIVERTVARLAQTFLLHSGITLVLNVKPSVMDRLSRCTEVSLIPSIDQVNQTTPMGHCLMFRLQRYDLPEGFSKTLMFFEGCPSHLGCSVVLRGGDYNLLKKVKKVLQFVIYANYHSRLEISFLMDEFAKPPCQSSESDSKAIASQDSKSALATGASDNVSDGLASGQDGMMVEGTNEQVDIVSEQAMAEEQELKDEVDAGKAGFRASMKKLIRATVASVKAHSHLDSDQEPEAHHGSPRDISESTIAEYQEIEYPEKLPENEDVEEAETNHIIPDTPLEQDDSPPHQPEESADSLKVLESDQSQPDALPDPQEGTQQEEGASLQTQGPTPDFDHEATTKEIESKFIQMKRIKLISSDSASFGSQEDLTVVSPTSSSKSKSAFSIALDEVLLSISPHVKFSVPFLESKAGRDTSLRRFFPSKELYWSPKLSQLTKPTDFESTDSDTLTEEVNRPITACHMYANIDRCSRTSDAVIFKPPHSFMFSQLTEDANNETVQNLLADFRARGGRITPKPHPSNHQSAQKPSGQTQALSKRSPERPYHKSVDCLDIYNHQRMLLQFCSYSHLSSNAPNHCVDPWIVTMDYYSSRHDLTLGEFLERYCFSTKYKCPNELCDADMVDHVRRFVNGNASIHILLRNLESPIPGFTDKILMWSWCRKCGQVTPVQPMSLDSWHMSFGKYLELRFNCKDYGRRLSALPCGHSLHRHHYQYFGQNNIVASFKYSTILLREICLPPLPLQIKQAFCSHPESAEEVKNVSRKGSNLLGDVLNKINTLTGAMMTNAQAHPYFEQRNSQFMAQYQLDNKKFGHCVDDIQRKIMSLGNLMASANQKTAEITDIQLDLEDSIVSLKQIVCGIAVSWSNRFIEFIQQEKERLKKKSSPSVSRQTTLSSDKDTMATIAAAAIREVEQETPTTGTPPKSSPRLLPSTTKDETRTSLQRSSTVPMVIPQIIGHDTTQSNSVRVKIDGHSGSVDEGALERSPSHGDSDIPPTPPSLAYYDHLGLKKMPNYGISPGIYAGLAYKPSATPLADDSPDNDLIIVQIPANQEAEPEFSVGSSGTTTEATTDKDGESKQALPLPEGVDHTDVSMVTKGEIHSTSPYRSKQSTSTMKTFFSTRLSSADLAHMEMPYPPDQHYVLPPCTVVPVIIYDQEPSTIIAYALSSEQYKTQLYELQQPDLLPPSEGATQPSSNPESKNSSPTMKRHSMNENNQSQMESKDRPKKAQMTRKSSRGVISFLRSKIPDNPSNSAPNIQRKDDGQFTYTDAILYHPGIEESSYTSTFTDIKDETDFEFSFRSTGEKRSPHIELQFTDGTNTQFFCLVYHADQFLQLRKIVFPAGEETYIRSLSRSVTWLAQGGKSRSKFLKTKDDRFVLKQISRLEFQSFKEFAPHYFKYIQQAHAEQRPTTLAKILGVYKVGYHNPVTNTAQKHVLLIMENLFYQRRMGQVFDLKGSIRNRHVKTNGQEQQDLVLMDENLLKHMVDSPLFVRSHNKAALTMAVHYDSMFLASHFIMDYSLLVGLDATTDELVVGIIDYIRTFTWDKKLEMMVKSTGIVGGQGKLPTVVSPELYRTRFCEAMEKYFLLVPDRWSNLGTEF